MSLAMPGVSSPAPSIPASYRSQPSCDTCGRCYRRPDYECGHSYYCTNDGRPRPRSGWRNYGKGSPEAWHDDPQWQVYQRWAWDRWARAHAVDPACVCDAYTPRALAPAVDF